MESKKTEFVETEGWLPGAERWGWGVMAARWYKLSVISCINPGDLTYSVMTVVNNTVLLQNRQEIRS